MAYSPTIIGASWNGSNHLILTLDTGATIDAGAPTLTNGTNAIGITSAAVNGSGHLIITKSDASTVDAGAVAGTSGTPGNLYNIISKSANYTVLAADVSGNTPLFLLDATSGNLTLTVDASLLFSTTGKAIVAKRVDASANVVTLLPSGSQTIDGAASAVELSKSSRTLVASSATALQII